MSTAEKLDLLIFALNGSHQSWHKANAESAKGVGDGIRLSLQLLERLFPEEYAACRQQLNPLPESEVPRG